MTIVKQRQNIFLDKWLFVSVVILSLLRFFALENKPIHHDESVNAWWVSQITEKGFFNYDPTNYHGPLFFYIQWIFERFLGPDLWVIRLVSVLFSIGTIGLLWKRNYRWGAFLMAFSPAFFFFSRSGIHEPMFVFFQLVLILGWLDLFEKKENAIWWLMIGLVGSLANKETWVISLLAMLVASRFLNFKNLRQPIKNLWKVIALGVLFWALLFTGFFQNPPGLLDFFTAYMPWLQTGTAGNGHDKSFWFWSEMVLKYETVFFLVFLAASICFYQPIRNNKKFTFIYVFFLIQFLIYSLIPYKTIWCLISLLWPICLLIDDLMQEKIIRKCILASMIVLVFSQSHFIYHLNFHEPIQFDHPYVYVQSTQELKDFSDSVNERLAREPGFADRLIVMALSDAWPFPWVFRSHTNLRYINQQTEAGEKDLLLREAFLVVTDDERISEALARDHQLTKFFLRKNDHEIFILERNP
jgi:uncharacterized protein (TIGR03663 family)